LPQDKGVEIAQQLCAGLAAAHDKGVLHRDLKPANIMIDGRGQVRITDFGLATIAGDASQANKVVGTPAYMAPEQIADGTTTIQSDLYSLGLVLHEVFTGKRVHVGHSIEQLKREHEQSSISPLSSTVSELDPVVDRAIMRCLEKQPHERPTSARAVGAALPGSDPLAAAIAAGETPSPEMVAAAGVGAAMSLRSASICLAIVVLGLLSYVFLAGSMSPTRGLVESSDAYAKVARQMLEELGQYQPKARPEFEVFGFQLNKSGDIDRLEVRQETLTKKHVEFWYRHSRCKYFQRVMLNLRSQIIRV
jgi:hypothetical protein